MSGSDDNEERVLPLNKTKEERLAQQRLCKRRQYAEIKNDPDLLALAKEKRRIKYLKDKEAKKKLQVFRKKRRAVKESKEISGKKIVKGTDKTKNKQSRQILKALLFAVFKVKALRRMILEEIRCN
ncbi:unnamed protein product [Parnassius mnemosyne]|uniref:Uncharacterized protein n=1 Tax=Parnassius mnemosyne TaxID=213953 RepID=A0AAV1L8G0_9NEOP